MAAEAAASAPVDDRDVTFVVQGGLGGAYDIRYAASYMRTLFPGSRFVLATQESQVKRVEDYDVFDEVVLTRDPGPLPPLKFGGEPHNVNRQIVSTAAGLEAVRTPLAVKLRTDSYLSSRKVLDYWTAWRERGRGGLARGRSRIVVPSFYTLNPGYDEHLAFHVSDWFNFGETADLRRMWSSCPLYGFGDATHYEREGFRPGSLPREREFRARYATEQWMALNYLHPGGPFPIRYHNDCSPEIARRFEEELVDNFLVVHPYDIDLHMPKHARIYRSRYANLRNYSFEDWKRLVLRIRGVDGPLSGHTSWPRSELAKALYLLVRRKRRMRRRERRP